MKEKSKNLEKGKIRVEIEPSNIEGYNYCYIFKGKREYREYDMKRYIRIIRFLGNRLLI